jgi:hypothetical protein
MYPPLSTSDPKSLPQGACLLSGGVLAAVELPALSLPKRPNFEVDEFSQLKSVTDVFSRSFDSGEYASPQEVSSPTRTQSSAQRSLFSERGYRGSGPHVCIFSSRNRTRTKHKSPLSSQNTFDLNAVLN